MPLECVNSWRSVIGLVASRRSKKSFSPLAAMIGCDASSGRCVPRSSSSVMRLRSTHCSAAIEVMSFVQDAIQYTWSEVRPAASSLAPLNPAICLYMMLPLAIGQPCVFKRWSGYSRSLFCIFEGVRGSQTHQSYPPRPLRPQARRWSLSAWPAKATLQSAPYRVLLREFVGGRWKGDGLVWS